MRGGILRGMAEAFFLCAWADYMENNHGKTYPGQRLEDVAPSQIDPAATHAAETLANDMARANGVRDIVNLYERDPAGLEAHVWGHYAAMQAMGHGVGLWEYSISYHHGSSFQVPRVEFGDYSLTLDYGPDGEPATGPLVDTCEAPASWASYLVNGDASGLEDDEQAAADAWLAALRPWYVVSTEGEPRFSHRVKVHAPQVSYDAGDLLTYIIHKKRGA